MGRQNVFWIRKGSILFSGNFSFRNFVTFNASEGKIEIGNNVYINSYSSINSRVKVSIGDDSLLGEGVRIYDHNHTYNGSEKKNQMGYKCNAVTIGKNVWIGSNAVILQGVSIGDHSVIAAGMVVRKSVPERTLYLEKKEVIYRDV